MRMPPHPEPPPSWRKGQVIWILAPRLGEGERAERAAKLRLVSVRIDGENPEG